MKLHRLAAVMAVLLLLAGCDKGAVHTNLKAATTTSSVVTTTTAAPTTTTSTSSITTTTARPRPTTTTTTAAETTAETAAALDCPNGTYTNSDGNQVCRPYASDSPPPGATAECNDGTYSFSTHRSGTCSGHGGVKRWL